ncbi:Uncharacterized protein OBRU01_00168, partial [Operophtera brumata]
SSSSDARLPPSDNFNVSVYIAMLTEIPPCACFIVGGASRQRYSISNKPFASEKKRFYVRALRKPDTKDADHRSASSSRRSRGSGGRGRRRRLLDIDEWWNGQQFECVCMLNLLDRCSKPKTMLKQARGAVAPGGVLMLALVLPYKPYVEARGAVAPGGVLMLALVLPYKPYVEGNTLITHKLEAPSPRAGWFGFEEQAAAFVKFMEEEAGFELVSWTRAPYLCEGDFSQAYYWLDDSVFVFTPKLTEQLKNEL